MKARLSRTGEHLRNEVLESFPPSHLVRTWGRVDSVGVWLPRNCFAGAHLRLPTSKQGGQCALLISCAGCGASPRSLASLRQSLRAPSVPHSLLSSQLRLQGPRLRATALSPTAVGHAARCSAGSLPPSLPHLFRTEPSGSPAAHFPPAPSHLCRLSFLRQGPIAAAPSSPAFLQGCSTCPAPRDSQPGAGHHPDCRLQGSPSGQTRCISYKRVASTLGVYILGSIQSVMQGNHHLKRYMHHCSL